MVNLGIRHEQKWHFDFSVCAAFLGLALFWTIVGFTVACLL